MTSPSRGECTVTPIDVLRRYERLCELTREMRTRARESAWEELIDLQTHYVESVAGLAESEKGLSFDIAQAERKVELLEEILENDLEVRQHLVERREVLGRQMQGTRNRQSLEQAYGASGRQRSTIHEP
ncbi:flagellar protein FliT [Halomonas marinisediminis]|uniref:Flagellar protein FliT n=1 Tax=Halomonas marinisediminis TaxID=2546095 RepID=A0ABY2D5K2_9GAMM|nr:flagellar protein FliT [Halomonas marinisediminis]TDB01957.1 flagellar protein FliT [Halomonas marinisediminis]